MWAHRGVCVLTLATVVFGQGVGDFVASGLGLAASSIAEGEITASQASSSDPTLASISVASASVSLTTGGIHGNVSVDECWSSWDAFWNWRHDKTEIHSSVAGTETSTYIYTAGENATTYGTYTSIIDTTVTIDNGGFAISTQTLHTTSRTTNIQTGVPTETSTSIYTLISYDTYNITPTTTILRPSCKLPTHVSQCQDQWENWIDTVLNKPTPTPPPGCDVGAGFLNGRTVPPCAASYSSVQTSFYDWQQSASDQMPACTQASIGGELCDDIRDEYVQMKANWFAPKDYVTAFFFSAGYLGMFENVTAGNMNPSYYWPTSQTLEPAPSCTLGCGRCAVTGGTVDVLYWPATATSNDAPAPTAPATLETLGTTLTSPTIYISYSNLYASNGCSGIGSTIGATIVPIPTDQALSSVYAGTIACDAHFRMTQVWTATASFNIADLNSPVPYSIYSSQPWCQTYLRNQGCQGTCPTDTPYKPIVVVPQDVLQQLQPEWSECFGDIRGAYDPPKALQPAATAAGPSQPQPTGDDPPEKTSDPAAPADGPGETTPSATYGAGPDPTPDPGPQAIEDPGLTANNDDPPAQTTQNAGGVVASLLGPDENVNNSPNPTRTQNAAGIIASLLGGGTSATTGSTEEVDGIQDDDAGAESQPSGADGHLGQGSVATIGSLTVTVARPIASGGSSGIQLINGDTTVTMTAGGVAAVSGQEVSVDSDGSLAHATNSETATLSAPTEGTNESASDKTPGSNLSAATESSSNVPQATGNSASRMLLKSRFTGVIALLALCCI